MAASNEPEQLASPGSEPTASPAGDKIQLVGDHVGATVERLERRIYARFGQRGLTKAARDLRQLVDLVQAEAGESRARLRRTTLATRATSITIIAATLFALVFSLRTPVTHGLARTVDWVPLVESTLNDLVFAAIAVPRSRLMTPAPDRCGAGRIGWPLPLGEIMSISVLAISFDARNAAELAQFWAQALHRTVNDGATEDFASVAADTDGRLGPVLMFHKVPEGKTARNRVHFDLQAAHVLAEADRLTSLGAQQIRSSAENNNRWMRFVDPEGNEFDLVASG
jgi:predicted enzyme related to lactoylglutathione lyase